MNSVEMTTEVFTGKRLASWEAENAEVDAYDFHAKQQWLRFGKKPYSVQYTDAIFSDLDAREIEYETHPYEESFYYVNGKIPGEYFDLDDPWYFSHEIEPQLPGFEQFDAEHDLQLQREPETFSILTTQDPQLLELLKEFLDTAIPRDPAWQNVSAAELLEYYHYRKNQIEHHANARLTQLKGEQ